MCERTGEYICSCQGPVCQRSGQFICRKPASASLHVHTIATPPDSKSNTDSASQGSPVVWPFIEPVSRVTLCIVPACDWPAGPFALTSTFLRTCWEARRAEQHVSKKEVVFFFFFLSFYIMSVYKPRVISVNQKTTSSRRKNEQGRGVVYRCFFFDV